MKRVLVTGASGYIGGRLAARLLSKGHEVHLLLRRGSAATSLQDLPGSPAIHLHDGTIEGMQKIMRAARPDTVFHLAAKALAEHAASDIEDLVASNIMLGLQLAEVGAAQGVERFINTGTFWQRRGGKSYDPAALYAATKQAFEDLLAYYCAATPLKACTLVLFDVYGPGDPRPKILGQLESARRAGKTLDLSPGRQLVDLVFVDDVVEAYIEAAALLERQPAASGRVWSVSSGRLLSLRQVVTLYQKTVGEVEVRWGGRPYRAREVFKPWRGPRLSGWKARVGLEEGLRRSLVEAR